jgi:hypothetical protein
MKSHYWLNARYIFFRSVPLVVLEYFRYYANSARTLLLIPQAQDEVTRLRDEFRACTGTHYFYAESCLHFHYSPLHKEVALLSAYRDVDVGGGNNNTMLYYLCDRLCGLVVRVLATDPEARVRFPALSEKSSGSGTGSTQPREYNWGATW